MAREDSDDLRFGHIVIVTARWLLVVAGFAFLLYRPASVTEVAAGTVGVLAIAAANFWLHMQILLKRPVEPGWVHWACAADVLVISLLVALQGGLESKAFVFYYPAVLCFALVLPAAVTFGLTAAVLGAYGIICLTAGDSPLQAEGSETILISRLLTLLAVAVVANRYREVESHRRGQRGAAQRALHDELEQRKRVPSAA
jgi:hypothetical protein